MNDIKIPYGKQYIDDSDINAVCTVLRSDWLTTGPKISEFERIVSEYVNSRYAVAVSSGTSALHCCMYALNIGDQDEVIVPSMTFAATANCVRFQNATPIFVDVFPDTLLINFHEVKKKITQKTKAIIAVDYAGQPCDYDELKSIANQHNIRIVSDACHSLGSMYKDQMTGSIADLTVFSFHPVKHITTGEGGMIMTNNSDYADRMKRFRNHGIDLDIHKRYQNKNWLYQIEDVGYNYRITDIQCALGISQMRKIPAFIEKRKEIASIYDQHFINIDPINPLKKNQHISHAYHLYVVQLDQTIDRNDVLQKMRDKGIYLNIHYMPVHLHPVYMKNSFSNKNLCPIAESANIVTLPIFPLMTDKEIDCVATSLIEIIDKL